MEIRSLPIFVYGTLKRGELREHCWPHPPRSVSLAVTRGWLYDLGAYPALLPGAGLVGGELWTLAADHLPATLQVLDEIEGFADRPGDLYQRRIVLCWSTQIPESLAIEAYTYIFADPSSLELLSALPPSQPSGWAFWSGRRRTDA